MMLLALALSLVLGQAPLPQPVPQSVPNPVAQPSSHAAAVRGFVDAFNARDIDAMLALATDDVEWLSVDGSKMSVETAGKDALRTSMTAYFKSCPTCRGTVEILGATVARVSTIETATWTDASGPRAQQGMSILEFRDGRIRRVYYFAAEPIAGAGKDR